MVWQLQLQILITDDDGMTELQILIIDDGNWYDSNVVTFRAADFNQIDHILMIQKLQNLDFTQSSDWELKHTHIIQCFIFISHM